MTGTLGLSPAPALPPQPPPPHPPHPPPPRTRISLSTKAKESRGEGNDLETRPGDRGQERSASTWYLPLSFTVGMGRWSQVQDCPPKPQWEACPPLAASPPPPSTVNGKVPRPIAWRVGRRERRTLSPSPSEEGPPQTPLPLALGPSLPSWGRTLSEWTAETDLRPEQTHLVSIRRPGSRAVEGTWKREATASQPSQSAAPVLFGLLSPPGGASRSATGRLGKAGEF